MWRGVRPAPLLACLLACRPSAMVGSPAAPASNFVSEATRAEPAPTQPIEDRDGDGILDAQDRCPDEPEDLDEFEDGDGCVDRDNDGDGILDAHELISGRWTNCDYRPENDHDVDCRNFPEDFNGVADHDGCPDVHSLSLCMTRLPERVHLDRHGRLNRDANKILDEIAASMNAAPVVEFWIEAHVDKQRDPRVARRMSQRAAEEVIEALVLRGVARERLEPLGFGDSRSLSSRAPTASERANDRRVEFLVCNCDRGADTPETHECR